MAKLIRILGVMGLAVVMPAVAFAQAAPPPPPAPPAPPVVRVPATPAAPPAPAVTVAWPADAVAPAILDLQRLQDEIRRSSAGQLMDAQSLALDARRMAMEAQTLAIDTVRGDAFRFEFENSQLFDHQDRAVTYASSFPGSDTYSAGKDLLNQRRYDDAIVRFDRVVAQKGSHVDGALYWKAYAQYKLGKTDDALATIGQLRRDHAQSRYLNDAKALEADTRRQAGQPVNPAGMDDDELKLLAITGIQRTDPARAIPLLEGVLAATNSLRVKKQALYVLGLSAEPKAYQILLNYAKGAGNPDLQLEAIRYIVAKRDKQTTSADLLQIYQSTQDTDVKMAVISALRTTRDGTSLTYIATAPTAPPFVRSSALSGLSGLLTPAELWTLYEKETNKDLKMQMVSVFGSLDALDQLQRIAKSEKDIDVRRRAVRTLGNMKSEKTGQMLVDLYGAESDVDTRKIVINALSAQSNAEALVSIARKEPSLALKTEIVRKLSDLAPKSKVAADYLMEIIK